MKNLLLAICLLAGLTAAAQDHSYIPGDLLVMLRPGADVHEVVKDLDRLDGQPTALHLAEEVSAPMRTWLLRFDHTRFSQDMLLRVLWSHPGVMLAQNNHIVSERTVPNDPQFNQQWHHVNPNDADIDSELAWDITTGGVTAAGDTIVVCIIENSDLPHPDLVDNAWFNWGEVPSNGIDDDGNGYVDDFQGWNPGGNNDNVYGGSHGTQVAGMIGAKGNNSLGVVGANWNVKMMVVTRQGISESAVIASYTYPLVMRKLYNQTAGGKGAFVVATNASWGIDNANPANYPLWCAVYDSLGAHGVLNCGATANNNVNVDVVGDMPTACASDFMVSVTATNNNDVRTFSGYGATTIDVGAPGENVRTTSIGGGYGSTSGTSFASPLTAGVIALLYSAPCGFLGQLAQDDPTAAALYIRGKLFDGVDQVGNLPGNTVTGGRINANNSLQLIMAECGGCIVPLSPSVSAVASDEALYSWNSTGGPFNVRYRPVGSGTWTDVPGITGTSYLATGLTPCVDYEFQVEALCDTTSSGFTNSTLLIVPPVVAPTIALAGPEVFCAGESVTLTSSALFDNVWSTGETTQSITVDDSGDYSVQLVGPCGSATSADVTITVLPVTDPVTSNVNLGSPGVATLTATGDSILWYDSSSGGTPVGSGNSWDTPFLSATTSYWCSNTTVYGGTTAYGGKVDNSPAAGAYHTNGTNYQIFTANEPFYIRSVKVYASGAGSRPIALVTYPGGTVVAQGSFTIPDGESRVQLDFLVPGPGTYGLRIVSGNPQLWRDGIGSNPAYPFPLGTFGTMTSSTAGAPNATNYYYFFYDWEVQEPTIACESDRVEVVVDVVVGMQHLAHGTVQVYPVPADHEVVFDLGALPATAQLTLELSDATGRMVRSLVVQPALVRMNTQQLAEGAYSFRVLGDGTEMHRGRLVVQH
ncbi:MAG: S8 family serine peptidase [Flavobacteriales bacterium]|nr:S8 family serine peptidase [Flavobacteriales bacterium]